MRAPLSWPQADWCQVDRVSKSTLLPALNAAAAVAAAAAAAAAAATRAALEQASVPYTGISRLHGEARRATDANCTAGRTGGQSRRQRAPALRFISGVSGAGRAAHDARPFCVFVVVVVV